MQTTQNGVLSQPHQQILEQNDGAPELEEVGELEEQLNQLADRIAEYRGKIPVQLKTSVSSVLTAQRPVLTMDPNLDLGPPMIPAPIRGRATCMVQTSAVIHVGGPIESGNIALLAGEEQKKAEKVKLLKQKISENASTIPVALNRMKECMTRIDKLQSCNGVIHPAFKRKRTS